MNRLWVQLSLAFVLVTLVSVGAVALIANWTAGNQFRQYLVRQETLVQSGLVDELASFYRQNGSWQNVSQVLGGAAMPGMGHGRGAMMGRGGTLRLADTQGTVVYDDHAMHAGQRLSAEERAGAAPVSVDGKTVGYLLLEGGMMQGMMTPVEQSFLDQLRATLAVAALLAGAFGVLLGLLVSRSVAAPLTGLATAARAFAAQQWQARAPSGGAREVAEVGQAFNAMADALQHAEEARRNLVADVAHELRTPLTVLQGNLRAMLDGVYPLERDEVATLYDETRLLSRLVDDLREIALAEAGQLALNLQALDAAAALSAAASRFAAAADMQSVTLSLLPAAALPPARADPDRLAQILQNLLANALRHTAAGGAISISAASEGRALRIAVRDTGEGIASEDLPHVFDRFYRSDRARARQSGGAGLGLAIARSLVEAMGGTIGVDSAPGQGSTFWFTLPSAGLPQARM